MEMNDFRKKILKVDGPRKHKVRNSFGVYDIYKYLRKHKWFNLPRPVTEHEFYTIIRQVNNMLADNILNGEDVVFPHRMGSLELRKKDAYVGFKNGKLITNLPIDWDRTLKLWSEDEEAYKERILIKMEEKEIFKVHYSKRHALYENKSFFTMEVNRDIKRGLKSRIKNRLVDAFKL